MSRGIDIKSWILFAKTNALEYRRRQATEVFLAAISKSPQLRNELYMKGGTLMGLAYKSPRFTKDIDFTTTNEPEGFFDEFEKMINAEMRRAAARLGYPSMICKVQSHEMRPPQSDFPWPTLRMKIGIAEIGTSSEKRLQRGQSTDVIKVDVSFNEKVYSFETIESSDGTISLYAYSIYELIAEKLRAILQQVSRNRDRGQDVYDICRLILGNDFSDEDRSKIFDIFIRKSKSRQLKVSKNSMNSENVLEAGRDRYNVLSLEIDDNLDYDRDYLVVKEFFEGLPWGTAGF